MSIKRSKYLARWAVSASGDMPSLIVVKPRTSLNISVSGRVSPPRRAASPCRTSSFTTSVGT